MYVNINSLLKNKDPKKDGFDYLPITKIITDENMPKSHSITEAKIAELKKKSTGELETMLSDKKTSVRNFRFAISGSKTRNVREGRALTRDIARILTLVKINSKSKITSSK